jgi:hypothetical protein
MLEGLFESQPATVEEHELTTEDGDYVGLLEDGDYVGLLEDGEIVAASSFETLKDAVLLINSDLFVTGVREPEEVRCRTCSTGSPRPPSPSGATPSRTPRSSR